MLPCILSLSLIALPLQFAFFAPRPVSGLLSSRKQFAEKRLHIVSITGQGEFEQFSIVAQNSWGKYLSASDNYTNVCDENCGNVTAEGHRLTNVLAMPDTACPHGVCDLGGIQKAQLKFVWGFIHEYKQKLSEGGPMPKWWFIKDDDTYVQVDRLMALAAKYDPNDRVFLANVDRGGCVKKVWGVNMYVNGGGGWLASAAMAEAMVMEYGDEWWKIQQESTDANECYWYDQEMGRILDKVENAKIVDMGSKFYGVGAASKAVCPHVKDLITLQMKKQWQTITNDAIEMTQLSENCFEPSSSKIDQTPKLFDTDLRNSLGLATCRICVTEDDTEHEDEM